MRTLLLSFLILVAIFISYSYIAPEGNSDKKEFVGTIRYTITVESKTRAISNEKLEYRYGEQLILTLKNGNYKMSYDGNDLKEVYYLKDKNKQYAIRKGIDSLYVSACDTDTRALVSSVILQSPEKVLDHPCKLVVNDLNEIKNYYWYDSTIYMDPAEFKKHAFSYLNVYYEKAQSPWLKYKYEGKNFNITYTAIEIKEENIDDKLFQLPNLPEAKFE